MRERSVGPQDVRVEVRAAVENRYDERADDRLYHPILDGEDRAQLSVEFFAPDLAAGLPVDQLDADADTFAHAPDAALDHKMNV